MLIYNTVNYTGAIGVGAAYFGGGRDPILMDSVSCGGTEGNLTQCKHKTEHNCQHSEDVGVLCNGRHVTCFGTVLVSFDRWERRVYQQ